MILFDLPCILIQAHVLEGYIIVVRRNQTNGLKRVGFNLFPVLGRIELYPLDLSLTVAGLK